MRKLVIATAVASLLMVAGSGFAEEMKIGVLDLNKVLLDSPQVAKAKAKLKKQFEPKEQKMLAQQKALQEDIKKYEKDSITMKSADLKVAQQKIMDEQKKLQDAQEGFQRDMLKAQNEAMQTVLTKVEKMVQSIAEADKLELVVTKAAVAYNNPKFDITAKVSKALKK